jgi:hypothetical protein
VKSATMDARDLVRCLFNTAHGFAWLEASWSSTMRSGGGGGRCRGSGGAGVKEEDCIVTAAVAGATLFMFTFIDLALIWFLQAPPPLCVSRSAEVKPL